MDDGLSVRGILATIAVLGSMGLLLSLLAALMVRLSTRLVGFRVSFSAMFKAVIVTSAMSLVTRGIGGKIENIVGFGTGTAVSLGILVYFLAWYFDRNLLRPDGSALGRPSGYVLAGVYGLVLLVLNIVAHAVLQLQ